MNWFHVKFSDVPLGGDFTLNGLVCKKKSTRTAWINESQTLWFYFGQAETVTLIKDTK